MKRECACCGKTVGRKTASNHARVLAHKEYSCKHCVMCGDYTDTPAPRTATSLVIHHIDEDTWNNVVENLMPLHHGCHRRWHNTKSWLKRHQCPAASATG